MILKSLENIRKLRKKYNLTQKELANKAGVSQSLIAKIESKKLDPTFTKAQLIFEALEKLQVTEEVKAQEIMQKKVYFAEVNDSLKTIIKIIKTKGISQLPVLSNGNVCGIITEGAILRKIMANPEKINSLKAEDTMEEAPPIVSPKTGLRVLFHLLQESPIVLVSEKGQTKGIISKADLLGLN
ncbi:MAG: CBS domain-containing protein [Nanoarchaeota archaeon]|nr:CBS domain-containing protein [Nanoarchaeota archaeon]MBU1643688.1 CBS domain-containing protein [Nanoarchaeota archaeon]MBU1976706.1 CBS domain-containing protein [Nanoarchaeota archaeon]